MNISIMSLQIIILDGNTRNFEKEFIIRMSSHAKTARKMERMHKLIFCSFLQGSTFIQKSTRVVQLRVVQQAPLESSFHPVDTAIARLRIPRIDRGVEVLQVT